MTNVAHNFDKVRAAIANAEEQYARPPGSVKLLAVSKSQPAQSLLAATGAGHYCFAENYLQELQTKVAYLQSQDLPQDPEWHFVGSIQSKKARDVAQLCDWVHSVERLTVAEKLSRHRPQDVAPLKICIQVNLDQEESKSGLAAEQLLQFAETIAELPQLDLRGLMAIPKPCSDPVLQRKSFAYLHSMYQELAQHIPSVDSLSAGMSGDFEMAIAEGSTMVRIGTALFGPRQT